VVHFQLARKARPKNVERRKQACLRLSSHGDFDFPTFRGGVKPLQSKALCAQPCIDI
jgi:hypothetical protein